MAICCEMILQQQGTCCEMISQPHSDPLRNHPLAHECHFAAHASISQPKPHFTASKTPTKPPFGTRVPFHSCEMGCEITQAFKNSISQPKTHFATAKPLAKHPFGTKCHFAAAKWAAKMPIGCENAPWVRKWPLAAKSPLGFEMAAKSPPSCEITSRL